MHKLHCEIFDNLLTSIFNQKESISKSKNEDINLLSLQCSDLMLKPDFHDNFCFFLILSSSSFFWEASTNAWLDDSYCIETDVKSDNSRGSLMANRVIFFLAPVVSLINADEVAQRELDCL